MQTHPPIVPKAANTRGLSSCWYTALDGHRHAQEFFDATPKCRGGLMALLRQVAQTGRVGKMPANGHQLQGKYGEIFEFKPGHFRFMAFRHHDVYFVTNGAIKKAESQQKRDWDVAIRLREEFFANPN